MRGGARLVAVVWALSGGTALAQQAATTASPLAGQPGIDVYSTLYPRPPSSTITQATTASTPPAETPQQPVGIPAGAFIVYPSITGGAFFDDNVFARNTNRQGDWAGFVRPEIGWRTNNWTNVESAGSAFVEKRWYSRFKSEDQLNGGATVGGTLRPAENTQIVGRLQYLHAHEDRGSSDSSNAAFTRPLSYDQFEAAAAVNQRFNRVWTSVGAAAAVVRFEDGTIGGTTVSQSYRNGMIGRVPVRVGYVVAPSTSVFIEGSVNRRDFEVDSFDSRGYRVVGGWLFEPGQGARIKGEIFAGYMNQSYSGAGFQDISTWTFGSALAFLLTSNLTATLEGRRDAKEASLTGGVVTGDGVSVIETSIAGRLDYLVAPNLVVGVGVAYLTDEFLAAGRTDHSWSPLFSARYFVNRNVTFGFDYRHLTFDSSGAGVVGYYRNVYLLSVNARI